MQLFMPELQTIHITLNMWDVGNLALDASPNDLCKSIGQLAYTETQ